MKKIISILLIASMMLAGCAREGSTDMTQGIIGEQTEISTEAPEETIRETVCDDHFHQLAKEPQTVEDPVSGYCGNTLTTVYLEDQEYTFWGGDSVTLTDILINLAYDPMKVCRCAAQFGVETEFGTGYEVNLEEGFARCAEGQADLTGEQVTQIQQIVDNLE